MADAVLFEFLHTEMVAELWAPDPDPGSGGKKKSLSVLEGLGFRVGQALGERLPRETLAVREELDALKFLCKDLWAAMFQKHMDGLRTNHQVGVRAQLQPGFWVIPRLVSLSTPAPWSPKGSQDCSEWQGYFFNFNLPLRSDPCSGLSMTVLVPGKSQ
ncbi:rCG54352, isoform CRA_f [Rattus norvegicus]|uniref:RCG54352, isoform CRA_f n=1 Tax=Rattus norvegicus TaxID=10116 RepID=A6J8P3_RAT|nr:rCG54352, isoform CRA_f [Rattus norvegicus]